jgi:hypothetical protein
MQSAAKSMKLIERTQKIGRTWGATLSQTWTASMSAAASVITLILTGSLFSTAMGRQLTLMSMMIGITISVCIVIPVDNGRLKLTN